MAADYRVDIKNTSGVKQAEITNFLSLGYTKERNAPGLGSFSINGDDTKLQYLTTDCQVEIYRRNKALGLAWYKDFDGVYRSAEEVQEEDNIFTIKFPGQMSKLADRIIAYPKGTVNRTLFTSKKVETILHTLVKYNATSAGTTADGRVRLATITGISVTTDGANGNTIDWGDCAEGNLLDELQKIADNQKIAFTFTNTGANAWQWTWVGSYSVDASTTQIFALDRGNVGRITYKNDRTKEVTVAVIGGKGEGLNRPYRTRTGVNYNVSTNNREMFVNASGETDTAIIDIKGDIALKDKEIQPSIVFDVIQAPNSYYGIHYDINYKVKGMYRGTAYTRILSKVTVDVAKDGEKITPVLEDV